MTENKFRRNLLAFLFFSKLTLILYVVLFLFTGMTKSEQWASISLLLPLFAAYLLPLWKDMVNDRHETEENQGPFLGKRFVRLNYLVFPLYVLITGTVLTLFVTGGIFSGEVPDFESPQADRSGVLAAVLAAIESVFGLYLGPVVTALTKKRDKDDPHKKVLKLAREEKYTAALNSLGVEDGELLEEAARLRVSMQQEEVQQEVNPENILQENRILKKLIQSLADN